MNQIERDLFGLLDMQHKIRDDAIASLSDDDLSFELSGDNLTLSTILANMCNVGFTYAESFRTLKMDHSLRAPGVDEVTGVAGFLDFFHSLDAVLKRNLTQLSDDQILDAKIDRGGWEMPVVANVHTYREALLIVLAKLDIYLRALQKELPPDWSGWIG